MCKTIAFESLCFLILTRERVGNVSLLNKGAFNSVRLILSLTIFILWLLLGLISAAVHGAGVSAQKAKNGTNKRLTSSDNFSGCRLSAH